MTASDTTPTPASAAKGEAVAWRFKYPDDGRWHYSAIEPVRIAETVQPLYAQPHPSQQAGTESIERAAEAAYRAYGFTSPWTKEHAHVGVAQPDTKEVFRSVVRAVLAALNPSEARG